MNEHVRENYFVFIRLALLIIFSVYGIIDEAKQTGVSFVMLLLVSFYIGLMSVKELYSGNKKKIIFFSAIPIYLTLLYIGKDSFMLPGMFFLYEALSLYPDISFKWYFLPFVFVLSDLSNGLILRPIAVIMMAFLYIQHNYVVDGYKKRMLEDVLNEHYLKKSMREKEYKAKEEMKRNMLISENHILEERAALSQTLHDKLGHNINGSVYQLEAAKVIMDKDTDKAKSMLQAVIDQLRTGMDEIRAILRKERPKKKELAMLQLFKLCEDCNSKGIKAELFTEGDSSKITDDLWEIILDNVFEAVSNSMKYSKCQNININLIILNKMIRCSISDDGIGCKEIVDGMGISGMRQRVRSVNGSLYFETEAGFTVTMILPINDEAAKERD